MLEQLKDAFSRTDELIVITDGQPDPSKSKVLFINREFASLTGYEVDKIDTLVTLWDDNADPVTVDLYKQSRQKRKLFNGNFRCRKASGEVFGVNLHMMPIHEERNDRWFMLHKCRLVEEFDFIEDRSKILELFDITSGWGKIGLWEWYPQSGQTYFSSNMYDILGLDPADVEPSIEVYTDRIAEGDRSSIIRALGEVAKEGGEATRLHRIENKETGDRLHIQGHAKQFESPGGMKKVYGIIQDVTEFIQLRREKERRAEFEQAILDSLPGIFTLIDENMNYERWNQNFEEVIEYSSEEIKSMEPVDFIAEEDKEAVAECVENIMTYGQDSVEARLKTKSGKKLPHYLAGKRFETEEKSYFLGYALDISKQWEYYDRLEKLVEQRETLLKEIHHRVKNNMAIISGLLDLQKSNLQEEQAVEALTESQLRLHTMAKVHEQLYSERDLTDISSSQYIENLLTNYEHIYSGDNIAIETDIEDFKLNVNQAIPLGLLFNELVTNACQHAFTEQDQGTISITLKREEEYIHAEIADNGKGMESKFDIDAPETLGFTIINTLKKQLEADMNIETGESGTLVQIDFKRERPRGSTTNLMNDEGLLTN